MNNHSGNTPLTDNPTESTNHPKRHIKTTQRVSLHTAHCRRKCLWLRQNIHAKEYQQQVNICHPIKRLPTDPMLQSLGMLLKLWQVILICSGWSYSLAASSNTLSHGAHVQKEFNCGFRNYPISSPSFCVLSLLIATPQKHNIHHSMT